jgi:flagellar basal body rod protein FlgC
MPLGAIDRARSGLNVAGHRLAASANNTANVSTEGYHEVEASGVEEPGGVRVHVRSRSRPGVDLVKNAVDRRLAATTYRANLAVVKTADDMVGETMDLIG